jgi:hypothetical protein
VSQGRSLVEVQVNEAIGTWISGPRNFSTWFVVARFALALDARFAFVAAGRVTIR